MATFNELVASEKPVLVDFSAEWCGPCKMMVPILQEVAHSMGEEAQVVKIDVDRNQQLAASMNVRGVPTLMIFKAGELLWRQSGVIPSDQLISMLKQYAN